MARVVRFLLLVRLTPSRTILWAGLLQVIACADCRARVLSDNEDPNRASTTFYLVEPEPDEEIA